MTRGPVFRRAGASGVLLDCGDLESALRVFRILDTARSDGELTVGDLVPAAETVLVTGGESRRASTLIPKLRRLIAADAPADSSGHTAAETIVPVRYTGEDLDEVAALTGMSPEEVVARHLEREYTVAFTGFAPGFAYLSGGHPSLDVPRRTTPRARVLAGSVGLAGAFTGVYPRESPGGWQIIGYTDHVMWDTGREQPAALTPGGRVRFVLERESIPLPQTPGAAPASPSTQKPARLRVVTPGLQSLIEDAGRRDVSRLGVGESGAADRAAYAEANRLVGNRPGAAVIELSHGDFEIEALAPVVLAFTGAPRQGRVSGPLGVRRAPAATPFRLSAGESLTLSAAEAGLRTMLGVRGGVDAPQTLGSRSRDTLAGLGPEPLTAGSLIALADDAVHAVGFPGTSGAYPSLAEETTLRVVLGPRDGWFDEHAFGVLFRESWEVTPRSDRVGVRLKGTPLTRTPDHLRRELPSEGVALGAIQVPADGQPVLFLVDRPLTGGYPVIAVVHDEDMDTASQLAPGCRVRFAPVPEDSHAAGSAITNADRTSP